MHFVPTPIFSRAVSCVEAPGRNITGEKDFRTICCTAKMPRKSPTVELSSPPRPVSTGRACGCCSQSRVGTSSAVQGALAGSAPAPLPCVGRLSPQMLPQSPDTASGCFQAKGMDGCLLRMMQTPSPSPPSALAQR